MGELLNKRYSILQGYCIQNDISDFFIQDFNQVVNLDFFRQAF